MTDVSSPTATMHFLDVGQGDATVAIDLKSRQAIVVDCRRGYTDRVLALLEEANAVLALVIVSHLDDDHFGGVLDLVNDTAATVLVNNDTRFAGTPEHERFQGRLNRLADRDDDPDDPLILGAATAGLTGRYGVLSYEVLAPPHSLTVRDLPAKPSRNRFSVVVRLDAEAFRALVTGDAEAASLARLLSEQPGSAQVDLLRFPHHGAEIGNDVTAQSLVEQVQANYVVISVGATNAYAHPRLSTLHGARDAASKPRLLCTQVTPLCLGAASPDEHRRRARTLMLDAGERRCAGTTTVSVSPNGHILSTEVADHATRVDGWTTPRCRLGDRPNT